MGGAALARLRQGPRPVGRAQRRRRPHPARPCRSAAYGLLLRGHGSSVTASGAGGRRVVVTGGAGFLGSHLCEALVARGDRVVAVDDLSTGEAANVAALVGSPDFELVTADVSRGIPVEGPVDA